MAGWRVVIETRAPGDAGASAERYEVTPPPEPGTERAVLRQLVTGIHPGAVELGHDGGTSRFADGDREIAARFEGGGPPDAPGQGTLFDA
ncbi:hypothetical protein [Miltoncostaea marina]|uniref:hypothetical protein n=1 Tax=Miltoncostaea marina TaxID=2843215 RepID=UPI001C3D9AFD|nr:hypothetical protein [Miltoncostaea marina]